MEQVMKKFTKGMLTLAFAIVMLLGLTISVHAADYSADDPALESGITLQQGDTVQLIDPSMLRITNPYQYRVEGSSSVSDGNVGVDLWDGIGSVEVEQEGNLLFKNGSGVAVVEVLLPEHADAWTIIKTNEGNPIVYEVSYVHIHSDGVAFEPWSSTTSLPSEPGSYYLMDNVTLSSPWSVDNAVNLCLNGHTITSEESDPYSVIYIDYVEAAFGLYDCRETGAITHAPGKEGSGIILYRGTFNMYGGTISGNNAGLSKVDFGGGVYVKGGTFNMSGGTISGNSAGYGGGVVSDSGTFNMSGGTITDNTASIGGGGIASVSSATFQLSGSPQITGNTVNNKADNIHLGYNAKAVISDELTTPEGSSGPQIGITMHSPGMFTSGLKNKLISGKTASDLFFSDDDDYAVSVTDSGEAQLVALTDIATGTCSFDDATYAGKEISPETMTLQLSDTDTRKLKLGTDYEITEYKDGGADMGLSKPKYVGDYTAIVKGIGIYKGTANVSFTIKKAPLTITAKDQTLIYNGEIQGEGDTAYDDAAQIAERVTTQGLQGTDELTSITIFSQGKDIGEYPITLYAAAIGKDGLLTDNYAIKLVEGTLSIIKAKPQPPKPQPPKPQPTPSVDKTAAKIALDAGVKGTSTDGKVTAAWGKVNGATSYVIFAAYCDDKTKYEKIKAVSGDVSKVKITKLYGKKLNPKKHVKYYVVAYQTVKGKKVKVAKSITAHVAYSKSKKYTNPKKVKVKKSKYTLKKGKKAKIKAKLVLQKKGKKTLHHEKKFRYASSNTNVAKVSKKGKIKAVGKGECTVYVYAVNGCAKAIKVKVK